MNMIESAAPAGLGHIWDRKRHTSVGTHVVVMPPQLNINPPRYRLAHHEECQISAWAPFIGLMASSNSTNMVYDDHWMPQ